MSFISLSGSIDPFGGEDAASSILWFVSDPVESCHFNISLFGWMFAEQLLTASLSHCIIEEDFLHRICVFTRQTMPPS